MGGLGLCGLDTGRKRVRGEGVLGGGVPERSLCWRSLNGEPVVWVGDRVWRKGHTSLPFAILKVLWNFAFNAPGSRVRDRVGPQSCFLAPLCFWLGLLCPGGWGWGGS